MKSLLYLCLIGAAIYAVLHLTHDPSYDGLSEFSEAHALGGGIDVDGTQSSWASDLRSLKPQVAAQEQRHLMPYERQPRRQLPYVDEASIGEEAESPPEAAPASLRKPKAKAASRKAKWRPAPKPQAPVRAASIRTQVSDRVVTRSEIRRARLFRRAERRRRLFQ